MKRQKTSDKGMITSGNGRTGNGIGPEGATALSEMLKDNTTLSALNINSKEKWKTTKKNGKNEDGRVGNNIGIEGAKSISEMLQDNATLTTLNLECERR